MSSPASGEGEWGAFILLDSKVRLLRCNSLPVDLAFPNSPFKLHQPFAPAGDQPQAIDKLVEGLGDGLAFQTLLGVTGSGKNFTMANVINRLGRPAHVLSPNKTLTAHADAEF